MKSTIIIAFIITFQLLAVVNSKLKYLDDVEVFDIMDLNNLSPDRSIIIEKEGDFKYNINMADMLSQCSAFREYKTVVTSEDQGGKMLTTQLSIYEIYELKYISILGVLTYKTCIDKEGREFKLIPAENLSDLKPTESFQQLTQIKQVKPFAPHFIILEDVALYGHGDIMTLDGTSHYLGTCRQYGPPGYDSINVKRSEVNSIVFEPVLNLVTLWTENYLNALLSFLPRYLSLIPILKMYPQMSVAKNMYLTKAQLFVEPILNYYGIHTPSTLLIPLTNQYNPTGMKRKLNFMNIEYGKVYFMKTLIAPISTCRLIPKQAVTMIRKAVHSLYALNSTTSQTSIIITDRQEFDDLFQSLSRLYGIDRVKRYSTALGNNAAMIYHSLQKTVRLFNNCKLFIAPHGAALANIMFMNPGSTVIEIRTETLDSWYFSHLSSLVKVNYHYSTVNKTSMDDSGLKFSVDDVMKKALTAMCR